jgi:aarF domain-containing kinase
VFDTFIEEPIASGSIG